MDINACFPSNYLRPSDLNGSEFTLPMERVLMQEMTEKNGDKVEKPVLFFKGAEKGLVLNKTNAEVIAEEFGTETTDWKGKRVTLCVVRERAFGEMTDCLRVRIPADRSDGPELVKDEAESAADLAPF